MECHNLCPGVGHVVCQAKIWQIVTASILIILARAASAVPG
jgi:hypothetical protein